MVKKKEESCCVCPEHPKGAMIAKGVVAIILGLTLWMEYLSLSQVFAIILVIMGIVVLFHNKK